MAFLENYFNIMEQDGVDFEVIRNKLKTAIVVEEPDSYIWLTPEEGAFAFLNKDDKEFVFMNAGKTWAVNFSKPIPGGWGLEMDDLVKTGKKGNPQDVASIYLNILKKKFTK